MVRHRAMHIRRSPNWRAPGVCSRFVSHLGYRGRALSLRPEGRGTHHKSTCAAQRRNQWAPDSPCGACKKRRLRRLRSRSYAAEKTPCFPGLFAVAGAGFGHISPTASRTDSPRFGGSNRRESSASGFSPRTSHPQPCALTLAQSHVLTDLTYKHDSCSADPRLWADGAVAALR